MRKWICMCALVMLLCVSAQAAEIPRDLQNALPDGAADILRDAEPAAPPGWRRALEIFWNGRRARFRAL